MATTLGLLVAAAPVRAGPFAYVVNTGSDNVSQYKVGAGGLLAPLSPPTVAAGDYPEEVAVSPDGGSVYVTNFGGENSVSQYDVHPGGRLTPKRPATVRSGRTPFGVTVSPDGKSVYVANFNSQSVSQYNVAADGRLLPKSPAWVDAGDAPHKVAVSPDGRNAYVSSEVGPPGRAVGVIFQYDVGPRGKLSPKTPPSVFGCAFALAVSPDGASVYATCGGGDGVSQYDVGPGGTLSPKDPDFVDAGNGPSGVAVSPDGGSVYVTNLLADGGGGSISQYDVGADGALQAKNPPTVATGGLASELAMTSDGRSVYVTSGLDDKVFQYDVGPGGRLSPKHPGTVATKSSPAGVAVNPVARPPTRPGWAGWVHNRASGCSARVQVPSLDANQQVTASTELFCPRPTQLTIRSRLRSDYASADVTVAHQGCVSGCLVSEPKGYRYFRLTCPKSDDRQHDQRYYSDIVFYPGTNSGAATKERSASRPLSPFCPR